MRRILNRCLMLVFTTSLLIGCSMIQQDSPVAEDSAEATQRVARARLQLDKVQNADVLIRLDNALLATEITAQLKQHSTHSDKFDFQNIAVRFESQFIHLTTEMKVNDSAGNVVQAVAMGEIKLEVSGDRLEWFPAYEKLSVTSTGFSFAGDDYAEATPGLNQLLLNQLKSELNIGLRESSFNHIDLQPVPLGEVEVGTRLVTFDNVTAVKSKPLKGMLFVTDSAALIEPSRTSILLDLSFVPDLAVCPADIKVSRAVFSRAIKNREPVDISSNLDDVEDLNFFYSEISGATRPMTIIHYWFADGQPVAVEELPIGQSERWRTWSSRGDTVKSATHWRVLVVEKESGCILRSQSIRTQVTDEPENLIQQDQSLGSFAAYRTAFKNRTADFPALSDKQNKVLIQIRRGYLKQVFQSAISDLQIETAFDQTDLPAKHHAADLLSFDSNDIVCEDQKCANPLVCTVNIAHCKRVRDTRECSSCLFRNPLNNRCLRIAEDPICVAAKSRQNAIYQQDYEACIAAAQSAQDDCQQLNNLIARSCEIETRAEKSACEATKIELSLLKPGAVLAHATADSRVSGQLSMLFSNFKISDDFRQLQQSITLKSRISVRGQLEFQSNNTDWLLGSCINAWSAPFNSRALSSTPLNSMLTALNSIDDVFTATWSGLVLPLKMTASPLESVFVSNPQLLAGCSIGLTVDKVEQAMAGQDADFFNGHLNLIVQPLATQIKLNPAQIELAGQVFEGTAHISAGFVSYMMQPVEKEPAGK